ncbi:hypothetical protein [Streptomyces sp. NWU339]|uniref:hypothetical protein n=1 Tax=Streptomyces sp. NWU339 TaxID=2185284 RepID=UPI0015E7E965|nr:hypothetical protein [Streptomyces sp. NWU339]
MTERSEETEKTGDHRKPGEPGTPEESGKSREADPRGGRDGEPRDSGSEAERGGVNAVPDSSGLGDGAHAGRPKEAGVSVLPEASGAADTAAGTRVPEEGRADGTRRAPESGEAVPVPSGASRSPASNTATGAEPVVRILPLGSGLVLMGLGLGLAFVGLRLRRS